jgi:hypothetical protein
MSLFFIRRVLVFTGFFVLAYCFSILLIGRNMNVSFGTKFYYPEGGAGHSQLRFQEAALQRNIDLLFIGSSHAYRNYDPRIFKQAKLNAFNLGSTAQTPVQTIQILENLGENLSPKYLIIDFFLPLFYNEGMESSIDLLANTDFYLQNWFEHTDLKWYNALVYRTLSKDIFRWKSKTCSAIIGHDQYIKGGYVESQQPFDPKHLAPQATGELNIHQIHALDQIIQWSEARNIPWIDSRKTFPYWSTFREREKGVFHRRRSPQPKRRYHIQWLVIGYPQKERFFLLTCFHEKCSVIYNCLDFFRIYCWSSATRHKLSGHREK